MDVALTLLLWWHSVLTQQSEQRRHLPPPGKMRCFDGSSWVWVRFSTTSPSSLVLLQLRQQFFGKGMLLGLPDPLALQADPQAFLQEYLRVLLALQVQEALVPALVQTCQYITSLQEAGLHLSYAGALILLL
ncbi:hypothetical protein E2C01_006269 [Portunus trituberculatus]|uniref:Uncharacterized protein n=1 Tax=Portunus trituberculatus TaxID=210409 RepID=A0A5B7CXG3_PORTR|nr:hypothetical protein [Portunus trituberculatus]